MIMITRSVFKEGGVEVDVGVDVDVGVEVQLNAALQTSTLDGVKESDRIETEL